MAYSSFDDGIPYPNLKSHMHERIEIPRESLQQRMQRYLRQKPAVRKAEGWFARFVKRFKVIKYRWVWWRVLMGFGHLYLRIAHRLEIRGRHNIPKKGAIFYLLHNGNADVEVFLSAMKQPVSIFTAIGNSFFADLMEHCFGFVARRGTRDVMVEKMIRTILKKNRYFAIWPEGSPARGPPGPLGPPNPIEPFSGIIRVYSVINSRKNNIPFVPVLIRGAESNRGNRTKKKRKILVEIFKPIYIPRNWLQPPEKGGKTPREIINKLMLVLARKVGFNSLAKNWALERRRRAGGQPWGRPRN